ncbi:MAG TPA: PP2C family serine/threonine-protein phosphatase [Patescibacteria group bacterium]|nr:PP2C family serine/threonine-protein phosphatase [Patescibacteria group bacterium]
MNPGSGFDMPRPSEQGETSGIKIASATVASEKHPDRNEDAFFHSQRGKTAVAGVFDGVGGLAAGDEASRAARGRVLTRLQEMPADIRADEAQTIVQDALSEADADVLSLVREKGSEMATTASILVICDSSTEANKQVAVIGNVGDSRVYRLRDGLLEQITLDDSAIRNVGDETQAKALQDRLSRAQEPSDLSDEDLFHFRTRNVVDQALGVQKIITPRIHQVDVHSSDRFFLASDGITDNLTLDEIQAILRENTDPQHAVNLLKEKSVTRSRERSFRSKPDDMTGVVIDVGEQGSKGHETPVRIAKPVEKTSPWKPVLPGEKVMVRRSSGEIDGDWEVVGSGISGNTVVTKEVDGRTLTKQIATGELERLNDSGELKAIVSSVQSEQELFDALMGLGGLQGSQGFHNSAELIAQVKSVMTGEAGLTTLTRTGDLRQKVADLMIMRRIRGEL